MAAAPLRRLWRTGAAALAAALLLPGVAGAGKKPRRTVVLFPIIQRDAPDASTVGSVADLLDKASAMLDGVTVLAGANLKKKVKSPEEAIDGCGTDLKCVAKLGKKLKAAEVMLGRASPESGGVTIAFVIVDVKKHDVSRKVTLTFPSNDDVKAVLGSAIYELFGITDPGFVKIEGATGVVRADGRIIGKGEGPHKLKPGLHELDVSGTVLTAMVVPGKTKVVSMAEGKPGGTGGGEGGAAAGEAGAVASADDPPALELTAPPPEGKGAGKGGVTAAAGSQEDAALAELALLPLDPIAQGPGSGVGASGSSGSSSAETPGSRADSGSDKGGDLLAAVEPIPIDKAPPAAADSGGGPGILTWVGVGVAALGAGAAGFGGWLYADSLGAYNAVLAEKYKGPIKAPEAVQRGAAAVENNNIAIGSLIGGGAVVLAGATLATLDLFVFKPKTSVEVGANSARMTLAFDW